MVGGILLHTMVRTFSWGRRLVSRMGADNRTWHKGVYSMGLALTPVSGLSW